MFFYSVFIALLFQVANTLYKFHQYWLRFHFVQTVYLLFYKYVVIFSFKFLYRGAHQIDLQISHNHILQPWHIVLQANLFWRRLRSSHHNSKTIGRLEVRSQNTRRKGNLQGRVRWHVYGPKLLMWESRDNIQFYREDPDKYAHTSCTRVKYLEF